MQIMYASEQKSASMRIKRVPAKVENRMDITPDPLVAPLEHVQKMFDLEML